ncbi:MAG: hypothetical protein WCJ17_02655 [bacterium]|jgi:hypothetical protein
MRTMFERIDHCIDRLLGEKGYTFLVSMGRYVVSLLSVALLTICVAHFLSHGTFLLHDRVSPHMPQQVRSDLAEFSHALVLASSASQSGMTVS